MSHLTPILDRLKTAVSQLTEQYGETKIAAEHSETMDTNHPNYAPMMTAQDGAVDKINDFISDLTGTISDIKNLSDV